MLGWMLKRGENAPDAAEGPDSTLVDQPDTPAPVFAARAFKTALFGTPAQRNEESKVGGNKSGAAVERGSDTPSKPQSILLTPGTATTRRKRVSFGHDAGSKKSTSDSTALAAKDGGAHKRTRLAETLQKARRRGVSSPAKNADTRQIKDNSEDDWEEEEDDDVEGGEDHCSHDITLDLNEPHSQSGRYWKEEFDRYQQDAKAELDKMIRYKQLAKSYAKEKDAEAIRLAEMLQDEQYKVIEMERKISENASEIVSQHRQNSDDVPNEMISKLTKQTTLAAQYRHRVQDLENQLEEFLQGREGDAEAKGRRRRQVASPTTQKTLVETQRELRRARSQVRELESLREQVSSLKAQLKATRGTVEEKPGSTRAQDLRAQLRQAKEESRVKDEELKQLKGEFESFRQESQVHDADTKAVLERAHGKIADLKKEVKALKTTAPEEARPKSWHPQSQTEQPIKESEHKSRTGTRRSSSQDRARRNLDSANLDATAQAPRDKYQQIADDDINQYAKSVFNPLGERPTLEKPKWQPFVPRSPRNRAYLGDDLAERIQARGGMSAATRPKDIAAPELPALGQPLMRRGRAASAGDNGNQVDLLQDRFARLGGPDLQANGNGNGKSSGRESGRDSGTLTASTARSKLPPERRAAAMARIERRMAEKKRTQRRNGSDKENVRP